MKKIISIFVMILFCLILFKPNFAEQSNNPTSINNIPTNIIQMIDGAGIDSSETVTTPEKKECQAKLQAINAQIAEKDTTYRKELRALAPAYFSARKEHLLALNTYKRCISEKVSTKMKEQVISTTSTPPGASGMTAHIAIANANRNNRWIKQNAVVTSTQITDTAISSINEINVDELELEIIELPENDSIECKEQRIKLKEKQTILKEEIFKIKELREKYKTDYISIKELQKQRQEIIRNCYPERPLQITTTECKVPKELLEKRKELEKKLMELQTEFTSEDNVNREEFIAKHKQIKEEFGFVYKKINSIEQACNQTTRTLTQESRCVPDEGLMQDIEKYKKSLAIEKNPDIIYRLKIALEHALEKMNRSCGISQADRTTSPNAQPISETEILRQDILILRQQIQEKNKEIRSLRESIREFNIEMKTANVEQRKRLLEENFDKVLEHTTAVVNGRITKLQEKIKEIEISTVLTEENKKKVISDLNNRIASLTQIIDKLNNATTTEELKQIMIDARSIDEKAILKGRVSSLMQSVFKLNKILDKYRGDMEKYDIYKANITELSTKVLALTENTTKEEIDSLVENYKSIKQEIISNTKPKENVARREVNN